MEAIPRELQQHMEKGSILGLERMRMLCDKLGNPQDGLKYIHIAGTNGKGSTAMMVMQILKAAGYRVGFFTSPTIASERERYQINGELISEESYRELVQEIKPVLEQMNQKPTEFEFYTALAFLYFAKQKCEFVVLEVGLGGRLDATNIIAQKEVAVITAIDYDHKKELGNTLEAIAFEKGGIIQQGNDVVLYHSGDSVNTVITEICKQKKATLHIVSFSDLWQQDREISGQTFDLPDYPNIFLPLLGLHQQKNAKVVLQVISVLKKKGTMISKEAVYQGFAAAKWPARFEVIQKKPYIILEGGHNPQCFQTTFHQLEWYFPEKKITFVIGLFADKEYKTMLKIIAPIAKCFYIVAPNHQRALSKQQLKQELEIYQKPMTICDTPLAGVLQARQESKEEDVICVLGSFYLMGEIRSYFERTKNEV